MVYYVKKRILKIKDKEYKLSKSEDKILLSFRNSNVATHKEIIMNIYGNDNKKLFLSPMYAIKERFCRRTGLKMKPYMSNGYKLLNKIDFVEE